MPRTDLEPARDAARPSKSPAIRVLVVDDKTRDSELVETALQVVGFQTKAVRNPLDVMQVIKDWPPDVIILDVSMPGIDGVVLARRLKESQCDAGLMFLTSRHEMDTVTEALDIADQYMNKPFKSYELVARVRVVLRNRKRTAPPATDPRKPRIDALKGVVTLPDGRKKKITALDIVILAELLAANGHPVSNAQLKLAGWGEYEASQASNTTLQQSIRRLRKKLERNPSRPELIVTVPGVGYRYVLDA